MRCVHQPEQHIFTGLVELVTWLNQHTKIMLLWSLKTKEWFSNEMENFKISAPRIVHLQLFRIRYTARFYVGETMIFFPPPEAGVPGGILPSEGDRYRLVSVPAQWHEEC